MLLLACYGTFYTDDSNPRFGRIQSALSNPMTEVYLFFYEAVLQAFIHFNKFLQREDPLIPVISDQINSFLRKIASKFLTVDNIKATNEDFTRLEFDSVDHQLSG